MNLEQFLIRVYEVGLLLRQQRKPVFCPLELEEKYKLFYGEDLPLADLGFTDFESLLLSQSEYFVRHDEVTFSCLLKEGYAWKYRIPRNPFARPKLVDLSDPLAPARSESAYSRSSSVSDIFGDYEDDLKPFHSISETEVQAVLDELMAVICDEERIQQKHEDLKVTDGKGFEAQEMAAIHQVIEGLLKKLEEEAAVLIRNEAEVRATLDEMLAAVCDEGKAAEENTCLIKMEENVDEVEEMAPQNMDQKLVDEHVTDTVQVLSLHNEVVEELKTALDKGPSLAPFSGSLAHGDDFNGGGDSELVESISKAKNPSPPRKLSCHHDEEGTGREKTLNLEEESLEKLNPVKLVPNPQTIEEPPKELEEEQKEIGVEHSTIIHDDLEDLATGIFCEERIVAEMDLEAAQKEEKPAEVEEKNTAVRQVIERILNELEKEPAAAIRDDVGLNEASEEPNPQEEPMAVNDEGGSEKIVHLEHILAKVVKVEETSPIRETMEEHQNELEEEQRDLRVEHVMTVYDDLENLVEMLCEERSVAAEVKDESAKKGEKVGEVEENAVVRQMIEGLHKELEKEPDTTVLDELEDLAEEMFGEKNMAEMEEKAVQRDEKVGEVEENAVVRQMIEGLHKELEKEPDTTVLDELEDLAEEMFGEKNMAEMEEKVVQRDEKIAEPEENTVVRQVIEGIQKELEKESETSVQDQIPSVDGNPPAPSVHRSGEEKTSVPSPSSPVAIETEEDLAGEDVTAVTNEEEAIGRKGTELVQIAEKVVVVEDSVKACQNVIVEEQQKKSNVEPIQAIQGEIVRGGPKHVGFFPRSVEQKMIAKRAPTFERSTRNKNTVSHEGGYEGRYPALREWGRKKREEQERLRDQQEKTPHEDSSMSLHVESEGHEEHRDDGKRTDENAPQEYSQFLQDSPRKEATTRCRRTFESDEESQDSGTRVEETAHRQEQQQRDRHQESPQKEAPAKRLSEWTEERPRQREDPRIQRALNRDHFKQMSAGTSGQSNLPAPPLPQSKGQREESPPEKPTVYNCFLLKLGDILKRRGGRLSIGELITRINKEDEALTDAFVKEHRMERIVPAIKGSFHWEENGNESMVSLSREIAEKAKKKPRAPPRRVQEPSSSSVASQQQAPLPPAPHPFAKSSAPPPRRAQERPSPSVVSQQRTELPPVPQQEAIVETVVSGLNSCLRRLNGELYLIDIYNGSYIKCRHFHEYLVEKKIAYDVFKDIAMENFRVTWDPEANLLKISLTSKQMREKYVDVWRHDEEEEEFYDDFAEHSDENYHSRSSSGRFSESNDDVTAIPVCLLPPAPLPTFSVTRFPKRPSREGDPLPSETPHVVPPPVSKLAHPPSTSAPQKPNLKEVAKRIILVLETKNGEASEGELMIAYRNFFHGSDLENDLFSKIPPGTGPATLNSYSDGKIVSKRDAYGRVLYTLKDYVPLPPRAPPVPPPQKTNERGKRAPDAVTVSDDDEVQRPPIKKRREERTFYGPFIQGPYTILEPHEIAERVIRLFTDEVRWMDVNLMQQRYREKYGDELKRFLEPMFGESRLWMQEIVKASNKKLDIKLNRNDWEIGLHGAALQVERDRKRNIRIARETRKMNRKIAKIIPATRRNTEEREKNDDRRRGGSRESSEDRERRRRNRSRSRSPHRKRMHSRDSEERDARRKSRSRSKSRSPKRRRRFRERSADAEERGRMRRSRSRSPKRRRFRERSEDSEERGTRRWSRSRSKSWSPKRRSHREGRKDHEKRGMGRRSRSRSRSPEPSRRNSGSQEREKTIDLSDDEDEVVIVD